MKRILDFIKNLFIFAYILVIIFVTVCLLAYNDYKLTVFGDKTLVPVIDEDLEPRYSVGDLLIIKKNKIEDIKVGDVIFFYRTRSGETTINFAAVTDLEELTATETTITVEGDFRLSSTNLVGKTDTASVIPNLGRILHTLESKWGFLFLGVFPSLLVFIYTLYAVVLEFYDVKTSKNKKKKKKKKSNQKSDDIGNASDEEQSEEVESSEETDEDIKKKDHNVETEESKEEIKEEIEEVQDDKKAEVESLKNMFSSVVSGADNLNEETKDTDKVDEVVDDAKEEKETEEKVEASEAEPEKKTISEADKKSMIEEKMKSLTLEQKKALIEAKLKSMTPEQKKALIEAKRKKLEEQKNGDS